MLTSLGSVISYIKGVSMWYHQVERESEAEGEEHRSAASHTHLPCGWSPQPRCVPCLGIKPFGAQDDAPTNRATWLGLKLLFNITLFHLFNLILYLDLCLLHILVYNNHCI